MRLLSVLILFPLLAGCGAAKGKVSGQVRFKGKALPGGLLTFQPANSKFNAVPVIVDEEGRFEVTLPVGEVQVAVDNRNLNVPAHVPARLPSDLPANVRNQVRKIKPQAEAPSSAGNTSAQVKPPGQYVAIPPRYYRIETSGAKFTVNPGTQTHDIELVP